jgi:hypothetical protein
MRRAIAILSFAACTCSKAPADAGVPDAPACPACPACAACPVPEPCPACEQADAVYYMVLARVIRGQTESFITRAYVHRGGSWYPVVAAHLKPRESAHEAVAGSLGPRRGPCGPRRGRLPLWAPSGMSRSG